MTKKLIMMAAIAGTIDQSYRMSDDGNGSADSGAVASTEQTTDTTDASNPSATTPATIDPVSAAIIANFNSKVDVQEVNFFFKKVTDEAGNDTKRPTVALKLPFPSVEGIIDIISAGGKGLELLQEAVKDIIIKQAREFVNADETITQDTLPIDKLSWEAVANMPQAERRGGGIAKEIWEAFAKDYIAIMPGITGKAKEKIAMAAKVLVKKFADVKTDKKVITLLKSQLALYANSSPSAEEYVECIQFLDKKADTLLAADSSSLLDAL